MDEVAEPRGSSLHRKIVLRCLLLLVTAISLYLLFPSLVEVFSSWRSLGRLEPWWAGAALLCEVVSFIAIWVLMRIALGTKRWFAVAASQMAGNAFGRIVPGGLAAAGGLQLSMLKRSGAAGSRAASALGAASALQLGTLFALPLLSVPAIVGGAPVDHSLLSALWLGAIALVILVAGIVTAFAFDRPLELAGEGLQWTLNRIPRRRSRTEGLPAKLLSERDFIRRTLGDKLKRAIAAATAKSVFDYLVLLCCLRALGVHPRPSLVLLAYVTASILAMIPITPGGLGFVEAGLVGTLALAGVSAGDAVVATLAYRLVSFWLPIPAGGIAYIVFPAAVPLMGSVVVGQARKRGRLLVMSWPGGSAEVRTGKEARPDRAVVEAPGGPWRLLSVVVTGKGRERSRETAVVDAAGARVATISSGKGGTRIEVPSGESFPYGSTGVFGFRRYRLGDDLFVARGIWRPGREFKADVADALDRRPDGTLLVVLAGTLTHWRIQQENAMKNASTGTMVL